jgi:hypothetical protein
VSIVLWCIGPKGQNTINNPPITIVNYFNEIGFHFFKSLTILASYAVLLGKLLWTNKLSTQKTILDP